MKRILVYMGGVYTTLATGSDKELSKILVELADTVTVTKQGSDYIVIPKEVKKVANQ
jgi:hypothetical protein